MPGLGQSSTIEAYQEQANSMWRSNDENGSIQMNMYSLGVIDLDLSISPDVFGLSTLSNRLLGCYRDPLHANPG